MSKSNRRGLETILASSFKYFGGKTSLVCLLICNHAEECECREIDSVDIYQSWMISPASEDFGVQPNTCQVDNHEQCVWSSLDHVLKSYAGNVGVHMPPASDSLN